MSARLVILHEAGIKMTKREKIVYNSILQREMKKRLRTKAAILIQRAWRSGRTNNSLGGRVRMYVQSFCPKPFRKVVRRASQLGQTRICRLGEDAVESSINCSTVTTSINPTESNDTQKQNQSQNQATFKNNSIINSRQVLLGMIDFKQTRLQCKYQISDKIDIMDIGIKIEDLERKFIDIDMNMRSMDKNLEVMDEKTDRLEAKMDELLRCLKKR